MAKSNRTDEPKEIVKIDAPSWLTPHVETDKSTEDMKEYRVLPRIKVIQSMTDQALKNEFGEASAIVSPGNVIVIDRESTFLFVPVFFFVEFCKWSDLRDKNQPAVVERSFDPASPIAACARDADRRMEEYEGGSAQKPFKYRYVEHLNFAGFIYGDHELAMTAVVIGFSRGEFSRGRQFINQIGMRKIGGKQVPLWAQVWQFSVGFRDRGTDQKWFGLDAVNPEIPYIKEEEAPVFQAQHEELKALFAERRIVVDREDEGVEEDAGEGVILEDEEL